MIKQIRGSSNKSRPSEWGFYFFWLCHCRCLVFYLFWLRHFRCPGHCFRLLVVCCIVLSYFVNDLFNNTDDINEQQTLHDVLWHENTSGEIYDHKHKPNTTDEQQRTYTLLLKFNQNQRWSEKEHPRGKKSIGHPKHRRLNTDNDDTNRNSEIKIAIRNSNVESESWKSKIAKHWTLQNHGRCRLKNTSTKQTEHQHRKVHVQHLNIRDQQLLSNIEHE